MLLSIQPIQAQWEQASFNALAENEGDPASIWYTKSSNQLSVDAQDNVHYIYYQHSEIGTRLVYQTWSQSDGWSEGLNLNEYGDNWMDVKLETADSGDAWMCYLKDNEIFVTSVVDGVVTELPITNEALDAQDPDLFVGSNGLVHVAWGMQGSAGTRKIHYANSSDNLWEHEVLSFSELPEDLSMGLNLNLVVTDDNRPHITHTGPDIDEGNRIYYLLKDEVAGSLVWNYSSIFQLESPIDFNSKMSIEGDYLHLVVFSRNTDDADIDVNYLRRNTSSSDWTAPTLLYTANFLNFGDVKGDDSGAAHVMLSDETGALRYFSNQEGIWADTILNSDLAYTSVSFDLNSQGSAYLAAETGNGIVALGDFFENVGIENHFASHGISLYPNPASDFIHVELPAKWAAKSEMELYDISGQLILHTDVSTAQSIPIQDLRAGLYIVVLRNSALQLKTTSKLMVR